MLDPFRTHDYLILSRSKILDCIRTLSPAQYTQQFPIGLGSIARTLTHIMICEWFYGQRILGNNVPPYPTWPIQDETPPPFAELEAAWTKQNAQTRETLNGINDWHAPIEYPTMSHHGEPVQIITASAADIWTQLVIHEIHHRAQALAMLRGLEVTIKGDIDFNALMYKRRPA